MVASPAEYALTGANSTALRTRIMGANAGAMTVTGFDATLTYAPIGPESSGSSGIPVSNPVFDWRKDRRYVAVLAMFVK